MNLLVNLNSLQAPVTGIGRYTAEILKCLIDHHHIRGFAPLSNFSHQQVEEKLRHLDDVSESNVSIAKVTPLLRKAIGLLPYSHQLRHQVQQRIIRKSFEECKDYIYWEPNYILEPFEGLSVASVHDLSHIEYPQYHSASVRNWLNNNLENTLNRADVLLTVSEFSKKEIIDKFSIAEEKIKIISPAVADEFKTTISTDKAVQIRQKYQLPENYILSVGTREPRKNLKTLLQAYRQLPKAMRVKYPLVIVGAKGWGEVNKTIQPMVKSKELIVLGYIAQQDIPAIYKASTLFIYISLYEGYGMPVAEAMATATAVITSKNSAMSEIAGDAAKRVNPLDELEIANVIQECLEDKSARQQLAEKGQRIMQQSSWQNSAETLLHVFEEIKAK